MNTVTIVAIILLVLAIAACGLMVYSIRNYHEKFKEMSKRNQMLAKKCASVEQQLQVEQQRKSPITGRSDSAELQELRRQIATLTRKGEEAERIQLEYNKCRERCRRLEAQLEAQQDAETSPSQAALEEELEQVKAQYGQLLEEYEQLQQTIGNEKAAVVDNASTASELARVKEAYARLRDEYEQLQQTLGDGKAAVLENAALSDELTRVKEAYSELLREKNELEEKLAGGGDEDEETAELTAELNRVKHAYSESLQEQTRLRELLERARVELVSMRGELQERENAYEALSAKLEASAPAAPAVAEPQASSDKYLALVLDTKQLETAGRIRFLNVLAMLDGSIKLTASTNIRLSELAMFQDGKVIPNPYFYRRFGTDGELGSDIQKIRQVMQFDVPDQNRRYRLTAVRPAVVEENGGAYRLVQPGELKLG